VRTVFFRRQWSEAFKWSGGLARWLRQHAGDFDVVDVHAVFSHSSISAGAACRRHGVPYVIRPHGALDPWSLRQKAWQKRALRRTGVDQLLRGAAAVQYTTPVERALAEAQWRGMAPGVVVPLAVADEFFSRPPATPAQPPYVLVLSRLHEKKNLHVLIQAFHAIAQAGALDDWRLRIAGDGEPAYVDALRRQAQDGPAATRIEFVGWVGGKAKHQLLEGARVFASPSHQENFGISLVEAMAVGVPVLVSPGVNLAPEISRSLAGWVAEPSESALAETLRSIAADPEERDRRALAARALASRFRWPAVIAPLLELYDRAAVQAGRRASEALA
jgi:glycosyltransferase involved in cell wall biosynthesis